MFGEPGEASFHFFTHHRYDRIELDLLAQRDHMVHVRATVSGHVDGSGTVGPSSHAKRLHAYS
jgi:hypothetical protein